MWPGVSAERLRWVAATRSKTDVCRLDGVGCVTIRPALSLKIVHGLDKLQCYRCQGRRAGPEGGNREQAQGRGVAP